MKQVYVFAVAMAGLAACRFGARPTCRSAAQTVATVVMAATCG